MKKKRKKFRELSKQKKRLIIVLSALGVVCIVALTIALWPEGPPKVEGVVIENGSVQSIIETSGTVDSENTSDYTILEGAYVKDVYVAVGSVVKAGDKLADFDAKSLNSLLSQKRSDYNSANNAYNEYKTSVKNAKASIPKIEMQIKEMGKTIAALKKEIAESEAAAAATETSTEVTTASPSDGDVLSELEELLTNLVNIKATIEEVNAMFESFNSLNGTSYDMASLMASSMDTPQNQLIQYELQMIQMNAQLTLAQTTAEGQMESVYKSLKNTAYDNYMQTKTTVNKLKAGWVAEYDGIVTVVNIKKGTTFAPSEKNASSNIDVSSIISLLSDGGDVSSLLSAFMGDSKKTNLGMEIENYEGFFATVSLDKYNLQEVSVGQQVRVISVDEDVIFDGEVSYVGASATEKSSLDIASLAGMLGGSSSSTSTALCKVKIKNPDKTVVVGFDVDLQIITAVVDNVPVVPVEAVRYDDEGMYVWIYDKDNKTVKKSYVTFGISEDTKYQLDSGAALGDTILIDPPKDIADGDKVSLTLSED